MRASNTRIFKLTAACLLLSATASAHFTIIEPPPASTAKDGKGDAPCGPGMNSNVVTAVEGGHEIDLVVDETVNHGGFYRVALALADASELPPDNTVYDSKGNVLPPAGPGNSDHADYETTPKFPVLADHLFAHEQSAAAAKYMGKVMLPNVNCDKCILQVIEFMAPHGSNGPKAGYFYHNCANLKITADPALPTFDPNGGVTGGTGGAGGSGGSGGAATAGAGTGGGSGASAAGAGGSNGGAAGSPMAGTGSALGGAAAGGVSAGGAPSGAGSPGTAGAATGAAGTATTTPNSNGDDDGGCGIARGRRGAPSAWAALGLVLALGRRRLSRLLTQRLGRSRPR
jgi:hypothetical protein